MKTELKRLVENAINDSKPDSERRVVFLKPNEAPIGVGDKPVGDKDPLPEPRPQIPMPKWMRYETDDEMRIRIKGS